jgi:Na+/melibiose symporter-like transporter
VLLSLRRLTNRIKGRWNEFRGYTPTDRNLFFLCVEIIPVGFASGALAFNGPFVLKLGASNALIGAMAALPALMIILFTLPAARFMDRLTNRKPWRTGSLGLSRLIYLLIALVPWLLPADMRALAVVGLVVIQAIPLALFNTAFWILIADVCPPDRRSSLFTTRTTLLSATVGISAFLSGIFLDLVSFPLNYQILNLFGFMLMQYSTYLVNCITQPLTIPHHNSADAGAIEQKTSVAPEKTAKTRLSLAAIRSFVKENRPFVNFNLTTLICWLGAWGAGPLYTIFLVRMLNFSNSWIGMNATLAQIAVVLSAPLWNRLIKRKGNMWIVLRTVILTGLYPILIVLMPGPLPILLIGFANTLNDTGIGIAHTGIFLDVIPPQKRSSFIAAHTTLMNVGAMIGPLMAAPLADVIGVPTVLVVCGVIRIIGGALFWILPPRTSPKPVINQPG